MFSPTAHMFSSTSQPAGGLFGGAAPSDISTAPSMLHTARNQTGSVYFPPPAPLAQSTLGYSRAKRPHRSYLSGRESANKRRMLCNPTEVAGELQRLHITKRRHENVSSSSDDEHHDDSRQSKRHSPEPKDNDKRVWATIVPLDGKAQRFGIDPGLLRNMMSVDTTPNQIVPYNPHRDSDFLLKSIVQCLGQPNACVYVATPSGTVWKASLIQTLHSGLPSCGPPEIRIEESMDHDNHDLTKSCMKPPPVICELPALNNPVQMYGNQSASETLPQIHDDDDAQTDMDI